MLKEFWVLLKDISALICKAPRTYQQSYNFCPSLFEFRKLCEVCEAERWTHLLTRRRLWRLRPFALRQPFLSAWSTLLCAAVLSSAASGWQAVVSSLHGQQTEEEESSALMFLRSVNLTCLIPSALLAVGFIPLHFFLPAFLHKDWRSVICHSNRGVNSNVVIYMLQLA